MITTWPSLAESEKWPLLWSVSLLPLCSSSFPIQPRAREKLERKFQMSKFAWTNYCHREFLLIPLLILSLTPLKPLGSERRWTKDTRRMSGSTQGLSLPHPGQLTLTRTVGRGWLSSPLTFGSTGATQSPGRIWPGVAVTSPGLRRKLPWQSGQESESVIVWLLWPQCLSVTSADTGCLKGGSVERAFVTEKCPNSYFTGWSEAGRQDPEVAHPEL